MKLQMKSLLTAAIAGATLLAGTANAALVKIDFSKANGTTSGNYNNINSNPGTNSGMIGNTYDLTDFNTGTDSGIDLTVNGPNDSAWGDIGSGARYLGTKPAAVAAEPASATSDGIFLQDPNETVTLSFSNLTVGLEYNFLIYGARGNNGADAIFTPTVSGSDNGAQTISNVLNNDDETVTITGTPNGSGDFTFTWTTSDALDGSTASALNFVQISEVPEPGSLALLGLGGLLIASRRRRA